MLEEKPAKGGDGLILALRVKELGCLGQSARKGRPGRRKREGHVEPWLHGQYAGSCCKDTRKPLQISQQGNVAFCTVILLSAE